MNSFTVLVLHIMPIYADDIHIYLYFDPKNPESLLAQLAKLERALEEIRTWLIYNRLKLNPDKTELIICVSLHLQHLVHQLRPVLRTGDAVVLPKDCVRDLGVPLDSELLMRPHINKVSRSVHYYLRFISRIRLYLDDTACATAVQAYVVSTWMMKPVPQQSKLMWFLDSTMQTLFYSRSPRQCTAEAASGSKQCCTISEPDWTQGTPRARVEGVAPVTSATTYISYKLLSLTYQALNSDTALQYLRGICCKETSGDSSGPAALHYSRSFHGQGSALEIGPSVSMQLDCGMTSLSRFATRSDTEVLRNL